MSEWVKFCWYFHFHFIRSPGHVTNASLFIQSSTYSSYIALNTPITCESYVVAWHKLNSLNIVNSRTNFSALFLSPQICWWGHRCPFSMNFMPGLTFDFNQIIMYYLLSLSGMDGISLHRFSSLQFIVIISGRRFMAWLHAAYYSTFLQSVEAITSSEFVWRS